MKTTLIVNDQVEFVRGEVVRENGRSLIVLYLGQVADSAMDLTKLDFIVEIIPDAGVCNPVVPS